MQGKRVLVSGAGGFIGRWSVPALLRLGYDVHAVLSGSASRDVPAQLRGAKIHFADLLDESIIDELTSEVRPSHLLHFAWIATPGVYWNSEENFRWLAASERLLRSFRAQGGSRVMMAGSCSVIGVVSRCSQAGRRRVFQCVGILRRACPDQGRPGRT